MNGSNAFLPQIRDWQAVGTHLKSILKRTRGFSWTATICGWRWRNPPWPVLASTSPCWRNGSQRELQRITEYLLAWTILRRVLRHKVGVFIILNAEVVHLWLVNSSAIAFMHEWMAKNKTSKVLTNLSVCGERTIRPWSQHAAILKLDPVNFEVVCFPIGDRLYF